MNDTELKPLINKFLATYQDIIAGRKVDLNTIKEALMYRIPKFIEDDGITKYKCPHCGKQCYTDSMDFLIDFCPFCGQAVQM